MANSFIDPLGLLLNQFYAWADKLPVSDVIKENGLDLAAVQAHAGILALIPCSHDQGFFEFNAGGELSLVIEVLGEDAETVVDLVAWPVARPEIFGTALGAAPVLGMTNVTNPATWALGKLCPIWRTPLQWLQTGCEGIVILDYSEAGSLLRRALGKFEARDSEHQQELRQHLSTPPVPPGNIIVAPSKSRRAA